MQNSNKTSASKDPFWDAFSKLRGYFLYATLFSAAINVLMLTPILYMLLVYDRVVSSGSMETLVMLTILMGALLIFSGSFEWARSRLLIAANVRLEESLRSAVSNSAFKAVLITGNVDASRQPMQDLLALRQFVTGAGIFALMDAPWTPIYIGIMYLFHPFFRNFSNHCCSNFNLAGSSHSKTTGEKLLTATRESSRANVSFASNLRNSEVIYGMGMGSRIQERTNLGYRDASDSQAFASAAAPDSPR